MIDRQVLTRPTVAEATASALRGICTSCAPPTSPADTAAKQLADRALPRSGWPACAYWMLVIGLWAGYSHLASRPGLVVATAASLAAGAWCVVNFWRCRQPHCVVTGVGWSALAVLTAVEAVLGHSLIGGSEGIAFVAILGVGLVYEVTWSLTHPQWRSVATGSPELQMAVHGVPGDPGGLAPAQREQ